MEELTGDGELILVVDDEATIREITKSSLEAYNYRVLTASDGVQAVKIYAQYKQEISVVLLDIDDAINGWSDRDPHATKNQFQCQNYFY